MKPDILKVGIAYWIGWAVCMCIIFYYDNIEQYRSSEKVGAEVVNMLIGYGRKRSYYYYPQLKFEYKDSSYLFAHKGFLSGRYDVGDKVTAIFPTGNPDKAELYSFLPYWGSLTKLFFGLMIAGFLFVLPRFFRSYGEFKKQYKGK